MGTARRHILSDGSMAHITWRCHSHSFYLRTDAMKLFILSVWLKYKLRYGITILDYIIMDNHCHLLVYVHSFEKFTAFMRATNSVIAKRINFVLSKDSAAIKDRYRSPVIMDEDHLINTIRYIWNNSVRAKLCQKPEDYRWCSLFSRFRQLPDPLLDDYDQTFKNAGLLISIGRSIIDFVRKLLGVAEGFTAFSPMFEHLHTIGSERDVKKRATWIYSRKMQLGP